MEREDQNPHEVQEKTRTEQGVHPGLPGRSKLIRDHLINEVHTIHNEIKISNLLIFSRRFRD